MKKKVGVAKTITNWESTGQISKEMATVIEKQFDEIIKYELGYIDEILKKNKSHQAFGRFSRLLSFLNAAIQTRPTVQKLLGDYLYNIRQRIDKIAKGMDVKEYHFTLNMPTGLLVNMVIVPKKK